MQCGLAAGDGDALTTLFIWKLRKVFVTSNINISLKQQPTASSQMADYGDLFWYNETETAGQRLKWLYSWIVNTRPAWRFMFKFHGYEHLNCTIVRLPQHRRGPGDEGILFLCELLKYILKLVLPLALSPILIHTNWALSIVTIQQNRCGIKTGGRSWWMTWCWTW